jgi:hypothetical protein
VSNYNKKKIGGKLLEDGLGKKDGVTLKKLKVFPWPNFLFRSINPEIFKFRSWWQKDKRYSNDEWL